MRARPRTSAPPEWLGWQVDDSRGRRLGVLTAAYEDEDGPAWFLVRLREFASRYVLVPPADALASRGRLWLPYDRETIVAAPPCFAPPPEVSAALEARLRRHFRLADDGPRVVRVSARRTVA